jgi:hypothetical protein
MYIGVPDFTSNTTFPALAAKELRLFEAEGLQVEVQLHTGFRAVQALVRQTALPPHSDRVPTMSHQPTDLGHAMVELTKRARRLGTIDRTTDRMSAGSIDLVNAWTWSRISCARRWRWDPAARLGRWRRSLVGSSSCSSLLRSCELGAMPTALTRFSDHVHCKSRSTFHPNVGSQAVANASRG